MFLTGVIHHRRMGRFKVDDCPRSFPNFRVRVTTFDASRKGMARPQFSVADVPWISYKPLHFSRFCLEPTVSEPANPRHRAAPSYCTLKSSFAGCLQFLWILKDADDWIRDVNYSNDGARLAVASNDCKIYIYAARDSFAKLSIVASHQSYVTHVDFSADGSFVQSVDGARVLMFAEVTSGVQIPSEHFRGMIRLRSRAETTSLSWKTLTLHFKLG